MGSLQTKIGVWNMALDVLREQPLSATTDTAPPAKWLSRNYDQQRDFLMESMLWKFAMTRANVAAEATTPAWGWSYQFILPTECLRIIPPTVNGQWMGTPLPYETENGRLLMNIPGPLPLRYIQRITNEGLMSNGFLEVLSLRLARKMAHWMTGKQSMVETIKDQLTETLEVVRTTEAVQVAGGTYYDTDVADDRENFF